MKKKGARVPLSHRDPQSIFFLFLQRKSRKLAPAHSRVIRARCRNIAGKDLPATPRALPLTENTQIYTPDRTGGNLQMAPKRMKLKRAASNTAGVAGEASPVEGAEPNPHAPPAVPYSLLQGPHPPPMQLYEQLKAGIAAFAALSDHDLLDTVLGMPPEEFE